MTPDPMVGVVGIVDYGMGNLLSVMRAVIHCGGEPELLCDRAAVERARALILPGVGAFRDGMNELSKRGLVEPLRRYHASGRPILGICLGMQMMMESSEEFGRHEGLGLVAGTVKVIPAHSGEVRRKVPHIGWRTLLPPTHGSWKSSPFESLVPGISSAYFVHSFAAHPTHDRQVFAQCTYDDYTFTAAIASDDMTAIGCQFHPEKSGPVGLTIVRGFLASSQVRRV